MTHSPSQLLGRSVWHWQMTPRGADVCFAWSMPFNWERGAARLAAGGGFTMQKQQQKQSTTTNHNRVQCCNLWSIKLRVAPLADAAWGDAQQKMFEITSYNNKITWNELSNLCASIHYYSNDGRKRTDFCRCLLSEEKLCIFRSVMIIASN